MIGNEVIWGSAGGTCQNTADDRGNFFKLIETDKGVDFGEFAGEFGRKALRHTACDDEALIGVATVEAAIAVCFENCRDTFCFRGVDKSAGVDDQNIGFGGVGG